METGFNNTKGFTLIELLITLVIIGIMSSMVFINFSTLNSVEARGKSFQRTFDYLSEESITTGNIVGWYADNDSENGVNPFIPKNIIVRFLTLPTEPDFYAVNWLFKVKSRL